VTAIHVRLRLGAESYALPVANVVEVGELGDVGPVPGSGPDVLGVLNLRGRVLPAFDLARVLGIPREGRPARLVVAESRGRVAGLAVDEVTGVEAIEVPSVDDTELELLAGSVLQDGELIGLIDVERVFSALEGRAT
jgi:purine-binding chemotaxis protein CheW